MLGSAKAFISAILLLNVSVTFAHAAEREDVRKVINLVTSVKMPYPGEPFSQSRKDGTCLARPGGHDDRLHHGSTIGGGVTSSLRATGNRAEMLRIRNEPSRGVYIGALYYYMVDFDLDGLIDAGSTTRIEALDDRRPAPR